MAVSMSNCLEYNRRWIDMWIGIERQIGGMGNIKIEKERQMHRKIDSELFSWLEG